MADFTVQEVQNTLKTVKSGKAAGIDDGVLPKFLNTLGPEALDGLAIATLNIIS